MSPCVKYAQQHQSQCSHNSEADTESSEDFLGLSEIECETASVTEEALENECERDEEGGEDRTGDEKWF